MRLWCQEKYDRDNQDWPSEEVLLNPAEYQSSDEMPEISYYEEEIPKCHTAQKTSAPKKN